MYRVRSVWSGGVGLPGYTNFYWSSIGDDGVINVADALVNVKAFWEAIKGLLPPVLRIDVDNNVDVLDPVTGNLTSVITRTEGGTVTPVANSALDGYSAPSGACVTWSTPDFVGGHRVKGRTFLVPLSKAVFDTTGSIQTGNLDTIRAAALGLYTKGVTGTADMVIWHRPRKANPLAVPPVAAAPGSQHLVNGHSVADKAAILTSRRD